MGASDDYLKDLGGSDWVEALEIIHDHLGKGATRYVSGALGVSMRQAQRMNAGAGITAARETASGRKHSDTLKGLAAALVLKTMSTIHAGQVRIHYEGRDQGSRGINDVPLDDGTAELVAGHLAAGNYEAAGDALDQAVLVDYGITADEMGISEYEDGLDFS